MKSYQELIESKIVLAKESGMKIADSDINPILFPHQRDITKWAVMGGRRAIFASFGLGKTFIQLEMCRIIQKRKGGKTLVNYWRDGLHYLRSMETEIRTPMLFDFEEKKVAI